jgi:hypothetical protein
MARIGSRGDAEVAEIQDKDPEKKSLPYLLRVLRASA